MDESSRLIRSNLWRPVLTSVAAGVLLVSTAAFADKLEDLGLDPAGRPVIEEPGPRAPQIVLAGDGWLTRVERSQLASIADPLRRGRRTCELVIAGPTDVEKAAGLRSPFPPRSLLVEVELDHGDWVVRVELPALFLRDASAVEANAELMNIALLQSLMDEDFVSLQLRVRDPDSGDWVSLDSFLPEDLHADYQSSEDRAEAQHGGAGAPRQADRALPRVGSGRPSGSLSGTDVYLNPGHGWVWRDSDYWGLQRSFVYNNHEDFSNIDTVAQLVTAYCYNAGADVFTTREKDPQDRMVVVDDEDGAPAYTEVGAAWFDSTLVGYQNGHAPYTSGQDPFSFGGNRLVACVVGDPDNSATWVADIPEDGWYEVYVSHGAFTNRSPQAHYRIYHAGGATDFYLDQRQRRFTWISIGNYFFETNGASTERKVVLFNDSSSASHYVSADAVRFGGGSGLISRGSSGTSGKPRFEEEARYNIQYSGAPDYDGTSHDEADGWSRRPRFGRWLKQGAEAYGAPARNSVFISSHTNAGGGAGLGTFVYSGYAGTWHDRFRDAVHDEVLNDLVDGYPGTYGNHGTAKWFGDYGENNPSNVSDQMPIVLGEWLFHDSSSDMAMYHDPIFRRMMARAIYQGIVKFWASEDGGPTTLLPEPPRNWKCVLSGATSATLSWDTPETDAGDIRGDAATGYRLYRSSHGRGFPAGTDIGAGTSTLVSDLVAGETTYFYLSATNAGGESFPTETLAVRAPVSPDAPLVLVVNGFDKLDTSTRVRSTISSNLVYRQVLHHMNSYDYIVEHLEALDATGRDLAVDSCEKELVDSGDVSLSGYDAVIWTGGIQAEVNTADPSNDTSFTSAQQSALASYLGGGGQLFVTGSEIAWDLDRGGGTSFVDTTLKASYVQDDSGSHTVVGSGGSAFAGLAPISFGSGRTYAVNYPEAIAPVGGSVEAMRYAAVSTVEDFDDLTGWWDPNSSGQTDADAATAFSLTTSIVHSGTGAGELAYVWGSGSFIREYNSSQTPFDAASVFTMRIYGDGGGHQVRLAIRDSDGDIFVNDWLTVDFNGWQSMAWDLLNDTLNLWSPGGNGTLDAATVALDSIQIQRAPGGPTSGSLIFDTAEASSGVGSLIAGVQYSGVSKVVFLGFPFETIDTAADRTAVMEAVLAFFDLGTGGDDLIFADGFESGDLSNWSASFGG